MRKCLVYIGDGIGNVISTFPLLDSIASMKYKIHIVGRFNYPQTADICKYPIVAKTKSQDYRYPKEHKYDKIIFTHWFSGRLRFKKDTDRIIYPAEVPDWANRSEMECNMDLVKKLGYRGKIPRATCKYGHSYRFMENISYIVVHPGYNLYYRLKCWDKWGELIDILSKKYNVYIVGLKKDKYVNFNPHKSKGIDIRGKFKLKELANFLHYAEFFIGNDSGLMHLSHSVSTKTYGIFGASSVVKNTYQDIIPIYLGLDCQGGDNCPHLSDNKCDGHCLTDLSVEKVLSYLKL